MGSSNPLIPPLATPVLPNFCLDPPLPSPSFIFKTPKSPIFKYSLKTLSRIRYIIGCGRLGDISRQL